MLLFFINKHLNIVVDYFLLFGDKSDILDTSALGGLVDCFNLTAFSKSQNNIFCGVLFFPFNKAAQLCQNSYQEFQ